MHVTNFYNSFILLSQLILRNEITEQLLLFWLKISYFPKQELYLLNASFVVVILMWSK